MIHASTSATGAEDASALVMVLAIVTAPDAAGADAAVAFCRRRSARAGSEVCAARGVAAGVGAARARSLMSADSAASLFLSAGNGWGAAAIETGDGATVSDGCGATTLAAGLIGVIAGAIAGAADSAAARGASLRCVAVSSSRGTDGNAVVRSVERAGISLSVGAVTGDSCCMVCRMPSATAPIVAAAAKGIHQRCGLVASAAGLPAARGALPTARCAAARMVASIAAEGISAACSRHAAESSGSRSGWSGTGVIGIPRAATTSVTIVRHAALRPRSAAGFSLFPCPRP